MASVVSSSTLVWLAHSTHEFHRGHLVDVGSLFLTFERGAVNSVGEMALAALGLSPPFVRPLHRLRLVTPLEVRVEQRVDPRVRPGYPRPCSCPTLCEARDPGGWFALRHRSGFSLAHDDRRAHPTGGGS